MVGRENPTTSGVRVGDAESAVVWRVCHVITGDCKRCPAVEMHHGDPCTRGCYLHAEECVNTVETGNPWRKTDGVRDPFIAIHSVSAASPATGSVQATESP